MARGGAKKGSGDARRRTPGKTRRRYVNSDYPTVVLKFEDGHEIHISQGKVKQALQDLTRITEGGPAGDPFVKRARQLLRLSKAARKTR